MIKTIFLSIAAVLSLSGLLNAETGVLTGKVLDASTKQPVPGANIVIAGTLFGAASDVNGNFTLSGIPVNVYRVKASAVGYESETKTDVSINSSRPTTVIFELVEKAIEIKGVIVESGYFQKDPSFLNSTQSLSYEEIRRAPGGFEDVIRALSVLPGVARAEPGRNDLIVRGGAPSENLFLVNGFEVQNINHFGTQGVSGGALSYINLDFVKGTTFSTGGFPVLYGDKISSVLKIDLRDGRTDKLGGKATISASQFGLNLEGPINEKSSFIFSARRSYLDFIFKAAGFGFVPEYYDVLGKSDYKLDETNSVSFLFTGAFDFVKYFNDTEDKRYDNSRVLGSDQTQYIAGLSFRHLFNKGFYTLALSRNYVDYDTRQNDTLLNLVFKNISREQVNALRGDVVYKISPAFEMNTGAKFEYIKFKADILLPTFLTSFCDTLPNTVLNSEDKFYKTSAYLNFITTMMGRVSANIGVRADYFSASDKKIYYSPRFSASYMFNDLTSLNFSTGIYYQAPSYIWLIGDNRNKSLKNIKAAQYILGVERYLREDMLVKIEGFLKDYSNYPTSTLRPYIILANTGAGYSGSEDNFASFGLEHLINGGSGKAKGVELSLQKNLSELPFYGILSLTYSKTRFIPLDGIERPGTYDQNWIFNLSGGYKINESWEAAVKFRYASGRPYTLYNNDGTQTIANYNMARLDPAHSLDVRVDKRWYFDNITLITYLDIQNIYNNKKGGLVRWDAQKKKIDDESSIGLLPSIGVSLEF
jgi:hypothetical protein